ncbi:MAG TPA: cbb3-type cytochrome c oxidase subunit 3 [Burkholderiaceae bacterium]|nr:cbb3-type cytochrome c oxidase subunit 3 [Burkholderiaceae bacterium]
MDINDIRSLTTVASFVLFVGLVIWSWQAKRRSAFDEAARLPFAEEAAQAPRVDDAAGAMTHSNPEGNR